jgi:hypothetical protein
MDRFDKDNITWTINGEEMESFTTMKRAVEFCKEHYAKYFIAVEKCDEDLFKEIRKEQGE